MSTYKIIGGTAGYNKISEESDNRSFSKKLFMFKPDAKVSAVFINKKTRVNGIILPAFDSSMNKTDTAYKAGYSPYRVRNVSDPTTGCPYFSDWFVTLEGYNYYGNGKMNFFSPKSVGCPDPIQELRDFCWKKHNAGDFAYDYLINRPEKFGEPFALPKTTKLTMLNVVCPATYEKDPVQGDTNRIMILKSSATDRLFEDLNEPVYRGMASIPSDEWTELFCRGDVTNPASAVQFTIATDTLKNNMEYTYLALGRVVIENGHRTFRCNRTVITEEQLMGRFDLTDTEHVIHVPSYQEIVDMLIQDNLVPFELIQTVCGEKANVVATSSESNDDYSAPSANAQAYAPAPEPAAPSTPAPAPAPAASPAPAPAPAPKAEERLFVTLNGQVSQMTITEINDIQDPDLPVYDGAAWKSAVTFPWYELKNMPVVAPAPAASPTPAPPAAMPSAAGRRTEAQEKRFNELNTKLTLDEPITTDEINELATLTRLLPYKG